MYLNLTNMMYATPQYKNLLEQLSFEKIVTLKYRLEEILHMKAVNLKRCFAH